jgi:hypothetical protein
MIAGQENVSLAVSQFALQDFSRGILSKAFSTKTLRGNNETVCNSG